MWGGCGGEAASLNLVVRPAATGGCIELSRRPDAGCFGWLFPKYNETFPECLVRQAGMLLSTETLCRYSG